MGRRTEQISENYHSYCLLPIDYCLTKVGES